MNLSEELWWKWGAVMDGPSQAEFATAINEALERAAQECEKIQITSSGFTVDPSDAYAARIRALKDKP